jgi:phosphoglycerate kinase
MSHLGRPKEGPEDKFSLKHVVPTLSKLLGKDVKFVDDCIGDKVLAAKAALKPGEVLVLENLRFYKEENKDKDGMPEFAKKLAEGCDVYVNDAFGTAHRAHASTAVIAQFVKDKMAGYLLEKEIKFLGDTVANPVKPFVAIVGGAKV